MKKTPCFDEWLNEAVSSQKVECAQTSNGSVLFKAFGKFYGKLHFGDVNRNDVDKTRNAEIVKMFLSAFPTSSQWQSDSENFVDAPLFGDYHTAKSPLESVEYLAAAKERNSKDRDGVFIGQVQLWDETKMTRSMSFGGPFSDVTHRISGTYVGGIFFAKDVLPKEALKFAKVVRDTFPGRTEVKDRVRIDGN